MMIAERQFVSFASRRVTENSLKPKEKIVHFVQEDLNFLDENVSFGICVNRQFKLGKLHGSQIIPTLNDVHSISTKPLTRLSLNWAYLICKIGKL